MNNTVPVKLCRTAGSIHLFKITGTLLPGNVNLKQNLIWNILELDWMGVSITLKGSQMKICHFAFCSFPSLKYFNTFYTLIMSNEDGSLSISVYRKPTHTDLYLQWDSHHTIPSKYSVIGTLHHRAQTICSNQQLLQQEDYLYRALTKCKYPVWPLRRIKIKIRNPAQNKNRSSKTNSGTNNSQNPYIVVPYYRWLSESLKKVCHKHGVQAYFKGDTTIKNLLMAAKDQDPIQKESAVIYRYKCDRVKCNEGYIGKSSRTFGKRFREPEGPFPNI